MKVWNFSEKKTYKQNIEPTIYNSEAKLYNEYSLNTC